MEKNIKAVLNENGFSFKKAYGQNFITDSTLLEQIVDNAGVSEQDTVIEIGCGAGTLTNAISKKAKKVIGYEIDTRLKPILAKTLEDCTNVSLIFKDIMKEKMQDIEKNAGGSYTVVANLPYYITTPIVMRFLEQAKNLKSMVIMVQEEVADRFSANPSSSDYGAITVGINLRGSAKTVMRVPREWFTPIPNVDSAVVKIDIECGKFAGVDKENVRNTVRIAFANRRKMLINNIMSGYKLSREKAEKVLNDCDISLTSRGENLSAEQFVILTEQLEKIMQKNKKTIVIASGNQGKIREFRELLKNYNIISLKDSGFVGEIEETGKTFYENALIKAKTVYEQTGIPTIADDSGICVDALDGAPGVFSARYSGTGNDEDNNDKLLKELEGVKDRSAHYSVSIVFMGEKGELSAEGNTYGEIATERHGTGGFGYDVIFYSTEINEYFGECSMEQKNKVSHRSRAIKKLLKLLEKTYENN